MISLAFKLDNEVATIVLLMESCKCSFKDLSGCELHEMLQMSFGWHLLKLSEQDQTSSLCLWVGLRKQLHLHFKAEAKIQRMKADSSWAGIKSKGISKGIDKYSTTSYSF